MRRYSKKILLIAVFVSVLVISSSFYSIKDRLNDDFRLPVENVPTFSNSFFKTDFDTKSDSEGKLTRFSDLFDTVSGYNLTNYNAADDALLASTILSTYGNTVIGIETAEDLYNLSTIAAFNYNGFASVNRVPYLETIAAVLSLDYVLLADIDYSIMRGQRFVPLGFDVTLDNPDGTVSKITYAREFTGTFDGQGYTIKNLYLADKDYITTISRIQNDALTDTTIPVVNYYAMFSEIGEDAIIKNFILENPIIELPDVPEGLLNVSYLAGRNNGTIYNVGVIDNKLTSLGADNSGILFRLQFQAPLSMKFSAAGFVHTNNATGAVYNSYFVSNRVIEPTSQNTFRGEIEPFYYVNNGDIYGAAFKKMGTMAQEDVEGYFADDLKRGKYTQVIDDEEVEVDININSYELEEERHHWHFYKDDGYPQLFGLNNLVQKVEGKEELVIDYSTFLIYDDLDLVAFSKMVNLNSKAPQLNVDYNTLNYILMNDINMINVVSYKAPSKDFKGELIGGDNDFTSADNSDAHYIYNLTLSNPTIVGDEYRLGFLGEVSGTVKNIIFHNITITATNTKDHYGKKFYIGTVASKTTNTTVGGTTKYAVIKNIITDSEIDLGQNAIGSSNVGGIVGYGNGSFNNISFEGVIDGKVHNFENLVTDGKYNIGGIVGASAGSGLIIKNTVNNGNITGIGAENNFTVRSDDFIRITIGGIIGEVNNQNQTGNTLYYVTNNGNITAGVFTGKSTAKVYQYVGGIFGSTINYGFRLAESDNTTIVNGRLENNGDVKAIHINNDTFYYTAGIGVANTSEPLANFSYMVNTGGYDFTGFNQNTHNNTIYYAATIIDKSTKGIRLSRAYNEKSFTYDKDYFTTSTNNILIAPFFTSLEEYDPIPGGGWYYSELLYVENKGNITVDGETTVTSGTDSITNDNGGSKRIIRVAGELRISGITQAAKIKYKNVYQSGNITVINFTQQKSVYVAGIAWILPYNQATSEAFTATNVINDGKIITAALNGNTTVGSMSGHDSTSATTFSSNMTFANIYVAGLFNLNVGEIRNSINRGDITSTNDGFNDIKGSANTFAGGIVSFNYNLIQDCINIGNITYTNTGAVTNTSNQYNSNTYVVGGNTPRKSSIFGGLVFAYRAGLTLGGIAAAQGDNSALILEGYGRALKNSSNEFIRIVAQIIDTSNKGDIYGKAKAYVRSGGILGVALGTEITAGTDNNSSSGGEKKFSYSTTGAGDPIGKSILSNGLNMGNIFAFTNDIGIYSGSVSDSTTAQRPGIFACAGGVIGYGLCEMIRMLNHGIVVSTDVAGGIIGATYIMGINSDGNNDPLPVTLVNINTAVHYGKVIAARNDDYALVSYTSMYNQKGEFIRGASFLYADNNTFMFPASSTPIDPRNKRGFGGIFGRLQRGWRGVMESNNFINIMNMDAYVDMVGRADMDTISSFVFFRFTVLNKPDTYYTARSNDTTPAVIVGYYGSNAINRNITNSHSVTFRIYNNNNNNRFVDAITNISNASGYIRKTRTVALYKQPTTAGTITRGELNNDTTYIYNEDFSNYNRSDEYSYRSNRPSINSYGFTQAQITQINALNIPPRGTATITFEDFTFSTPISFSEGPSSNTVHKVEVINENGAPGSTYVYGDDFPLMDSSQSDFIFYAQADALAPHFDHKTNGMYVLASSKASEAGVALPGNVKIDKLYKLNENQIKYINFDNPINDVLNDNPYAEELEEDYKSIFQLSYNEKSFVLPIYQGSDIADIVLYDPNGISPILEGGIITNTQTDANGRIISIDIKFTLPNDAFTSGDLYYKVKFAELSENAVIAKYGINYSTDYEAFYAQYNSTTRTSNILTGNFEPILMGTIGETGEAESDDNYPLSFVVYAEIAAEMPALFSKYNVTYNIIIEKSDDFMNVELDDVYVNDAVATDVTLNGYKYTVGDNLSANGSIEVIFKDSDGLFPHNHNIVFDKLYYLNDNNEEVEVDINDYNLIFNPINKNLENDNDKKMLGFKIELDSRFKSGTYRAKFKYYDSTTLYTLEFVKANSELNRIIGLDYPTYSSDALGEQQSLTPVTENAFETFMSFGNTFNGIMYKQVSNQLTINTIYSDEEDIPDYFDDILYFEIVIGDKVIRVILDPFTKLLSATAQYDYNDDGYRQYILTYSIQSEDENATAKTITHTITERVLPTVIVYKDGNLDNPDLVSVARESLLTKLDIDFGFPNSTYNQYVRPITTHPTTEVYYSHSTYFEMYITMELDKGTYPFEFELERDDVLLNLSTITIKKELGTNAYITDIIFEPNSEKNVINPKIYVSNSSGEQLTMPGLNPMYYYNGLDYAGYDESGYKYFRIDGLVSQVDLQFYTPRFVLPAGATIQMKVDGNWVPIGETDFLGEGDYEKIVEYRVLPEDHNGTPADDGKIVYYFITATDPLYILTIRFNLYYQYVDEGGITRIIPYADSPLGNKPVVINVKNYKLKEKDENEQDIVYNPPYTDANGKLHYPFEEGIKPYIDRLNTHATLFYYIFRDTNNNVNNNYLYTFGRNLSGAYSFTTLTPIYNGPTNENQQSGKRHAYSIYLITTDANGEFEGYPWYDDRYILPEFDTENYYSGKYFYILGSTNQIIRNFAIVIHEDTVGADWGLNDDYDTWN